jgi:hypothetical protein
MTLRPQEYYYLSSPLTSNSVEMIKYTFQGLLITGHLSMFYKWIYINKNAKYKRQRVFSKLGPAFQSNNNYSKSEQFVLSLYSKKPELRLYEIRNMLLEKLDDNLANFKSNYILDDLRSKKLCSFRFIASSEGKKARKHIEMLLETFNTEIDLLLSKPLLLHSHLTDLGPNIVLLEKETLEKLKQNSHNLDELHSLNHVTSGLGDSFALSNFDSFESFDNFSSDSSDFGGFDGGDFGGAGSGDLW